MAKPKFYLEPRPSADGKQAINLFYSFNGQRLQYYTGIRTDIKYFQPECNTSHTKKPIRSIAPFAEQDNNKLKDMASAAVTIVSEAKGENLTIKYVREQLDKIYKHKAEPEQAREKQHTFISYYEQYVDDCISGKRLLLKGKNKGGRYGHNAIKNYKVSLSAIKRYLDYQDIKNLSFEDLNKDFYVSFSFYCYNVEKKEISTFSNYIKDIKTVLGSAGTFETKSFIKPSYEADTVYLNLNQIDKIAGLDLSDPNKSIEYKKGLSVSYATLDKVRDLFLIGAYTGLRFSDFSRLDIKSIEGNFIKLKQIKTGGRITIPIMSRLRPVLDKHPDALPAMSNQKFNDYIKIVGQLSGLTEKTTVSNTKGNTKNESISPLYSLISSHCCRRSYATNMFKAGVPPMLIMSATGHKTETSFLKYIRANNNDKAKLLAEAMMKLGL